MEKKQGPKRQGRKSRSRFKSLYKKKEGLEVGLSDKTHANEKRISSIFRENVFMNTRFENKKWSLDTDSGIIYYLLKFFS
ncbi:hypothetical protein AYI68_g746 [Smittium mucronatum]|uniref:Uncharacterized protein n=1 Tax=Smittium mucronatum TaxID=133383 RepID=A0A1R0H7L3_9FUNG|nr:hypothetical protein AYI68_g746 [Smittium mucronatum]